MNDDYEISLSSDSSGESAETSEAADVEEAAEEVPRLFLDTPFNDYTVSEGLLLLLFLLSFLSVCARLIKGAFSWL